MPQKIVIAIPTEGFTAPEPLHSIWQNAFHLGKLSAEGKFEFYFKPVGRILTAYAREKILESALQIGADYVMMVDDDMVFPGDIFERLYSHQVDIVAALAFTRNPPHLPVLYQMHEGWDSVQHKEYAICEWIKNYPKDRLVECDAVGFGCVLIDMKIVRKMTPQYFCMSSETGEDILFCLKAKKEAGARVFMDTSLKIGHLGNGPIITEDNFHHYNDPKQLEILYAPYNKYGVYEVTHSDSPKLEKETVTA